MRVSINLSTLWQMPKKEVIFCEIVFVAVRMVLQRTISQKASNYKENSMFSLWVLSVTLRDVERFYDGKSYDFLFIDEPLGSNRPKNSSPNCFLNGNICRSKILRFSFHSRTSRF